MEGAPLDTGAIAPAPEGALPSEGSSQSSPVISDEVPPAPPALPGAATDNTKEKARQTEIRYKEVRVQAEKDPQVAGMMKKADKAKTDEDKRAALREYYRLLFAKMVSIDKSLADKCKAMELAYIRQLAQERLEPTIPLNPPPTPAPLN